MSNLAAIVEADPDPAVDGVVRWRRVDLKRVIEERFKVIYSERSVSALLRVLSFSFIGGRPQHPAQDRPVLETFEKTRARSQRTEAICPRRGAAAALILPKANTEAMQMHLDEICRNLAKGAHAVVLNVSGRMAQHQQTQASKDRHHAVALSIDRDQPGREQRWLGKTGQVSQEAFSREIGLIAESEERSWQDARAGATVQHSRRKWPWQPSRARGRWPSEPSSLTYPPTRSPSSAGSCWMVLPVCSATPPRRRGAGDGCEDPSCEDWRADVGEGFLSAALGKAGLLARAKR